MTNLHPNPNRPCPICESSDNQLLFKQTFSALENNLLNSYEIVVCNKCGFCFSDKIPNQEVFDLYYKEMSKYEKPDNDISESKYDIRRFEQVVEYLNRNISNKNSCIVEIGCSTGLLLSLLEKGGFNNLLGIDPSPTCAATVKKKYEIPALCGTITDLSSIENESVDLVILVGVLEHIRELDSALEEIIKVLKPDGKICIVVPDASQYLNGNDAPFQEFSVEHINFFGPGSLSNLMFRQNFSKIVIEQQVFEVNYNTLTPVIFSIFRKNLGENKIYKYDGETVANFKEYINVCHTRENYIQDKIKVINKHNEPLIIWGTGAQTLRLLANSDLSESNIIAFVDSNPKYQGKKLKGISIISPEEIKGMKETILISTRAYQHEIEHQIKTELKLMNKVIKLY